MHMYVCMYIHSYIHAYTLLCMYVCEFMSFWLEECFQTTFEFIRTLTPIDCYTVAHYCLFYLHIILYIRMHCTLQKGNLLSYTMPLQTIHSEYYELYN